MKAASFALPLAASVASGCSAATAANVMPMIVSARVVKTLRPCLPSFMRAAVSGA
jgi:hypothetical protein